MCPCFKISLFDTKNFFRLLAVVFDLLKYSSTDGGWIGTPGTPSGGTGGESPYPPSYSAVEYIRLNVAKISADRFKIGSIRKAFMIQAGRKEQDTAFTGWFKRWKPWGSWCDPNIETHVPFMVRRIIRSYDDFNYDGRLATMMTQLRADAVLREGGSIHSCCGGSDLREEWLVDNHVFCVKDIDFVIHFRRTQGEFPRRVVVWHNLRSLVVQLACRGEVSVSVPGWWSRYDVTRFLYLPIPRVFFVLHRYFQTLPRWQRTWFDYLVYGKHADDDGLFLRSLSER